MLLNKYTFEGKNLEETTEKCLKELDCELENLYVREFEQEGKLFKAKKVIVEAIKKEDVIKFIKDFLTSTTNLMGIPVNMEVKIDAEIINVTLVSESNPILIGKDGRTLNSLQVLLRQALSNQAGFNIKVNLDASNYKARKMNNLEYEIKKIAKEVLESKVDVKLDPMNSYERRLVHTVISEFNNLETESVGEAPERSVVIKYKED